MYICIYIYIYIYIIICIIHCSYQRDLFIYLYNMFIIQMGGSPDIFLDLDSRNKPNAENDILM